MPNNNCPACHMPPANDCWRCLGDPAIRGGVQPQHAPPSAELTTLRTQLAEVTAERDRLREQALNETYPLEVKDAKN